jgi:hypothetical protein
VRPGIWLLAAQALILVGLLATTWNRCQRALREAAGGAAA